MYQEDKPEPISGVEYFYKTESAPFKEKTVVNADGSTQIIQIPQRGKLSNRIQAVNPDGTISEKLLGIDSDITVDSRRSYTEAQTMGISPNLISFLLAIFPGVVFTAFPKYQQTKTDFRSLVVSKVINRYGILDEVVAYDLGSRVSTKNKLYDQETGQVLLTETVNQFDDPIYSFTYPAHWVYEGMGMAYQNSGYTHNGDLNNINTAMLYAGDELMLTNSSEAQKGWVLSTNPLEVVDYNNQPIDAAGWDRVKVLRSGFRNMQANPVGSVVSLESPIQENRLVLGDRRTVSQNNSFYQSVLNAEALEYGNAWKTYCNCGYNNYDEVNDYANGRLGNWRVKRSLLLLTGRTQEVRNNNTNIREDGTYTFFEPYWTQTGTDSWGVDAQSEDKWTWTSRVTLFSPRGQEFENIDALGRYSGATYGYSELLPTAVANNAQHREIGFEGFEDLNFLLNCEDSHFKFEEASGTKTQAHSGKYSLFLAPGEEVRMKKILKECPEDEIELPIRE